MRDVQYLSIGNETLVVATDNSGAVGLKERDKVKVPYDVVGYYAFRVAAMECYCAGGDPQSIILQNFNGDDAWGELVKGVNRGLNELSIASIPISGSTESNFSLDQSATGITILGRRVRHTPSSVFQIDTKIAVVGLPLVGSEVMENETKVAPLKLVKELSTVDNTVLLPVGSKGILYELNVLFSNRVFVKEEFTTSIDLEKSSGPSTCFLVTFPAGEEQRVKELSGPYYHELWG